MKIWDVWTLCGLVRGIHVEAGDVQTKGWGLFVRTWCCLSREGGEEQNKKRGRQKYRNPGLVHFLRGCIIRSRFSPTAYLLSRRGILHPSFAAPRIRDLVQPIAFL